MKHKPSNLPHCFQAVSHCALRGALLWLCMCISLCALMVVPAAAFSGGAVNSLNDGRKLYENGFIRIIYTPEGPAAVKPADADRNGIPDQVEDFARQFWAARHVLCDIYGFPDPIGSKRYPNVRYIEVTIRSDEDMLPKNFPQSSISDHKSTEKQKIVSGKPDKPKAYNGVAYSRPEKALNAPNGVQSLRIALNHHLNPARNTTAAHEFFHLVQNTFSVISTRWYYEGLARWSEDCLAQRRGMLKQIIPDIWNKFENKTYIESLNAASYDGAMKIWYPAILTLKTQARIPLPKDDPLKTLTYSDKSPVLKDGIFPGAKFVLQFLENLHAMQEDIKTQENYPSWDVQFRKDPRNTPHLLKAMKNAQGQVPNEIP